MSTVTNGQSADVETQPALAAYHRETVEMIESLNREVDVAEATHRQSADITKERKQRLDALVAELRSLIKNRHKGADKLRAGQQFMNFGTIDIGDVTLGASILELESPSFRRWLVFWLNGDGKRESDRGAVEAVDYHTAKTMAEELFPAPDGWSVDVQPDPLKSKGDKARAKRRTKGAAN